MNNIEQKQERIVELEAEVVEYRMILETIRSVARTAPRDIPREALFSLCSKALTQEVGAVLQAEFLTLKMLEAGMRQELVIASRRPDENSKEGPAEMPMWVQAMEAIVVGNNELLSKLDEIRSRARQKEASRLILPG